MKVHFVCTGNAYRSRLAEAYFNSKQLPGFTASSSGIRANYHRPANGPISEYAKVLLEKDGILRFTTVDVTQTTLDILEEQDYFVFMRQIHYDFCVGTLKFKPKQYEIWEIKDVNEVLPEEEYTNDKDKVNRLAEETYLIIKNKTEKLIEKLTMEEEVAV